LKEVESCLCGFIFFLFAQLSESMEGGFCSSGVLPRIHESSFVIVQVLAKALSLQLEMEGSRLA